MVKDWWEIEDLGGKLQKKAGLPKCRFHDLRHLCASIMLMQGVNVKVAKEHLGHKDISTTIVISLKYPKTIKMLFCCNRINPTENTKIARVHLAMGADFLQGLRWQFLGWSVCRKKAPGLVSRWIAGRRL